MNIKSLVAKGRGPMIEFLPEPEAEKLAQTIVAMANSVGGTIIVGMDERGQVISDVSESFEAILTRSLHLCTPSLRLNDLPQWRIEETPKGAVATVAVKPTPYVLSLQGREVFVRSGTLNVRLEPEQVARGRHPAPVLSFEDDLVPGASLEDLDEAIIQEYERNRLRRGPRGETLTRDELLRDAGAIDAAGNPTVAGILLFGKNPQYYFPQAGVLIVRFKGTSVREAALSSERYLRRVELAGPAARLVEKTWEVLFEEIHQQPTVNGLQRQEHYAYPPEAVREAVVNAICHRDYTITGQRIEIRLFDDRMEIMSPGGLPGHITLENILDEHYSRNPRLVRGLYYWGYIEELGQGIDIIMETMAREHHPAPEFRDTGRSFTVILNNAIDELSLLYGDELNPRQIEALRFLQEHERITNRDFRLLCPDVS
ncbi:MAG: putative DNA binding domain-containing protein, partial [Chloroflexi bacterium]|nr:putative DNA binding domain-containing protein [Chloroflexota bacterium]